MATTPSNATTKRHARGTILLCVASVFASIIGCTPAEYALSSEIEQGLEEAQHSIAFLKGLYAGTTSPITHTMAINGWVIANDAFGEWGDAIVVQDSSGGIEVAISLDKNAYHYPVGQMVTILCTNLWTSSFGGKTQMGSRPTDGDNVSVLYEDDAFQYIIKSDTILDLAPKLLTIPELRAEHISTYVEFNNLKFVIEEGEELYCDRDIETGRVSSSYRTLVDSDGNTIRIFNYYSCKYATLPLPTEEVDIRCIVDYWGGEYILRIINMQVFY